MKRLIVAVAVLMLSGCTAGKQTNYNKTILNTPPANYKEKIVAEAKDRLFDPYSVKSAAITQPTMQTIWRGVFGGAVDGWLVCVEYNAKNRMGGYTGIAREGYFFREDGRFEILPNLRDCNQHQLAYIPFPDLEKIQ
jgi:hypothetical protein